MKLFKYSIAAFVLCLAACSAGPQLKVGDAIFNLGGTSPRTCETVISWPMSDLMKRSQEDTTA